MWPRSLHNERRRWKLSAQRYAVVFAIVGLVATVWVLLTRTSGLTYHFFPLVISASAPVVPAMVFGLSLPRLAALRLAGGGLLVVATGWAAMALGGFAPTATFVAGQPGGVPAEVVFFALLGAWRGVVYAIRLRPAVASSR